MTKRRLSDVDLQCLIESVRIAAGKSPALPFSDIVLDCLRELQERRCAVQTPVSIDWICGCGHATKAEHEAAERHVD